MYITFSLLGDQRKLPWTSVLKLRVRSRERTNWVKKKNRGRVFQAERATCAKALRHEGTWPMQQVESVRWTAYGKGISQ